MGILPIDNPVVKVINLNERVFQMEKFSPTPNQNNNPEDEQDIVYVGECIAHPTPILSKDLVDYREGQAVPIAGSETISRETMIALGRKPLESIIACRR